MFSDFYTPPCIVTFAVAETYRYLAWLKSNYNAWFDIRNIIIIIIIWLVKRQYVLKRLQWRWCVWKQF